MRRSSPFGDNSTSVERCNRLSVERELLKKYDRNEWRSIKDDYGVSWLETEDGSDADIFSDVMEEQAKVMGALDKKEYEKVMATHIKQLVRFYCHKTGTNLRPSEYADAWKKLSSAGIDINEWRPNKFELFIETEQGSESLSFTRFAIIMQLNEEE